MMASEKDFVCGTSDSGKSSNQWFAHFSSPARGDT